MAKTAAQLQALLSEALTRERRLEDRNAELTAELRDTQRLLDEGVECATELMDAAEGVLRAAGYGPNSSVPYGPMRVLSDAVWG